MAIGNFVEKFAFAIEVEVASLNADSEFKALPNWDSLNALSVIAMADADYGVALSGEDIQSSHTISDLWNIVEAKI